MTGDSGNSKIFVAFRFHANFYHSYRGDTADELGFGKDIRIIRKIIEVLDGFNAEVAGFRGQLFGWFAAVAATMLIAFSMLLRGLLKPLRQIEQELEQDPTFSQRGYRVSRRRSILLALGLIVGLVITIGGLAVSFVVAFAGFVLVLVMAILLESELRLLGRERLGQLPISAWLSGRRPDVDDDATR